MAISEKTKTELVRLRKQWKLLVTEGRICEEDITDLFTGLKQDDIVDLFDDLVKIFGIGPIKTFINDSKCECNCSCTNCNRDK